MEFTSTIKQNYEFRRLYSKGKSCANAYLVVYCRKNRAGRSRIGYTVSNKVGHAVVRNRIRRRLREIYCLHERQIARGYDLVVVSRVRARTVDYHQLEAAFLSACAQLGLLTLIQKAYSILAYLAIPVILVPYVVHMIATRFDTK